MNNGVSRRNFLRTAAIAAAVPALAGAGGVAAAAGGSPVISTLPGVTRRAVPTAARRAQVAASGLPVSSKWTVTPFNLDKVSLTESIFTRKRALMMQFLNAIPADRILAVFRTNAGLDTKGAQLIGGWEGTTQLRGHFAGHFLTAFAQSYSTTGDAAMKTKIDYIVAGLEECRQVLATTGSASNNIPSTHPGYLSAYPEIQFATLETATPPGDDVWAPWYTCHKIMRGLLDVYQLTGNALALQLADGMGEWAHGRLSVLPKAKLTYMWSLYSKGEFGGMPEVLVDLGVATGKQKHKDTAAFFDIDRLITNGVANTDVLNGIHSNQHIPIYTGWARMADEGADQKYYTAAKNFWTWVVPPRMYAIGGTSQGEFWQAANSIANNLSTTTCETCCAYNMLKLSRLLFFHEQKPAYMDYYERALFNQILGSRSDLPSTSQPNVTYYISLLPGARREYGNIGTCCGGSGMENPTKYQDSIYFRSKEDTELYVNLFIPSAINWEAKGVTITQTTSFPESDNTTLTISGSSTFGLKIRVPNWAVNGHKVELNGTEWSEKGVPGTYLTINRAWQSGDKVKVTMPMRLRTEKAPDNAAVQSMHYGPIVLGLQSTSTAMLPVSMYSNASLDGDLTKSLTATAEPLVFQKNGLKVVPFYQGTTEPTHVYFRRSEPDVVFGGESAGVRNPTRSGKSFLDEVWEQAPFASRIALVERVRTVADIYVTAGLFTKADKQRVLLAAGRGRF